MMKKITELTEDQKTQFKPWVKKWVDIGLSTEPADFDRAEKAALAAYDLCGLDRPMIVLRTGSPYAATIAGAMAWDILKKIKNISRVGAQVWAQVRDQVCDQVRDQVCDQVCDQVRDQVGDFGKIVKNGFYNYGLSSLWCMLPAFASFFRDICKLNLPEKIKERININEALVSSIGWTWWHENVLVLSDRPKIINLDDQGRLHCENGPAIEYRDGWALYYWHGVAIPQEWISGKKPTAQEAISWPKIEQRRAACEIIGWANILSELDVTIIDTDDDPQVGVLLECSLPDAGNQRFLKVVCGTGRSFILPVHPNCKTALEGNLWTYSIDADRSFIPEVRT